MRKELINTAYTIDGEDGAFLTISETTERDTVVISIQRDNKIETVRLNEQTFAALCELKYELNWKPWLVTQIEKEETKNVDERE